MPKHPVINEIESAIEHVKRAPMQVGMPVVTLPIQHVEWLLERANNDLKRMNTVGER
jgi:hypothetical protein